MDFPHCASRRRWHFALPGLGFFLCLQAQAVPSSFDGLVQVSEDYRYSAYILNQLFDRSTYARAGARVIFEPMQPDPDTGQDVYAAHLCGAAR